MIMRKNRLKESTRSLKEIKKFLLKTDQHQKKNQTKTKKLTASQLDLLDLEVYLMKCSIFNKYR